MPEATLSGGRVTGARVAESRRLLRTSRAKTTAGKSKRLADNFQTAKGPIKTGATSRNNRLLREGAPRKLSGATAKANAASRKGLRNRATGAGKAKTRGVLAAARRQGRPGKKIGG